MIFVTSSSPDLPFSRIIQSCHLNGLLIGSLLSESNNCERGEKDNILACEEIPWTTNEFALTNVEESAGILDTLHGTARRLLLLLLLGDLGGLSAHLTGTCK